MLAPVVAVDEVIEQLPGVVLGEQVAPFDAQVAVRDDQVALEDSLEHIQADRRSDQVLDCPVVQSVVGVEPAQRLCRLSVVDRSRSAVQELPHLPLRFAAVRHVTVGREVSSYELLTDPVDAPWGVRIACTDAPALVPLLVSAAVGVHGFCFAHGRCAGTVLGGLDVEATAGDGHLELFDAAEVLAELAEPVHDLERRAAHHLEVELPVRPALRELVALVLTAVVGGVFGVGVEGHDGLLWRLKVESRLGDGGLL